MATQNVLQVVYPVLANDLFAICDLFVWVKSDLHVWVIKRSQLEEAGIWPFSSQIFRPLECSFLATKNLFRFEPFRSNTV